ncbi:Hypothetical predicted protein [Mytilus galloprovincialis]|uniref:SRCR domain-containing protein n=1 Tax=Mytilus galloprovincialis TaxID=29158 RepID=A0A8B6CB83_MYTGA|nr:Hypothetical predicted protein [Mytilus galloprovincialis]
MDDKGSPSSSLNSASTGDTGHLLHELMNLQKSNAMSSASISSTLNMRESRGMVGNPRIHFEDRGFLVSNIECIGNEQSLAECNRNITRVGSCQAIATAICMNK